MLPSRSYSFATTSNLLATTQTQLCNFFFFMRHLLCNQATRKNIYDCHRKTVFFLSEMSQFPLTTKKRSTLIKEENKLLVPINKQGENNERIKYIEVSSS